MKSNCTMFFWQWLVLWVTVFSPLGVNAFRSGAVMGDNVVVISGDAKLKDFEKKTFHNSKCQIELVDQGKLVVRRKVNGNWQEAWSTGSSGLGNSNYYAQLDSTGSLGIYDQKENPDLEWYRTASYAVPDFYGYSEEDISGPYRLRIDEACVLRIYGKLEGENIEIWSNRRKFLTNFDVLQQGDMLLGFLRMCQTGSYGEEYCLNGVPTFLRLQNDCNIVQKLGDDRADDGDFVWASDTGGEVKGDYPECYILVGASFVGLYQGKWNDYAREDLARESKLIWKTEDGNWEETEIKDDMGFYADGNF